AREVRGVAAPDLDAVADFDDGRAERGEGEAAVPDVVVRCAAGVGGGDQEGDDAAAHGGAAGHGVDHALRDA
ncbi:hypothetical protein ADL26_17835, partial [Thermoactinomyces vulgaris]